MKISGSVEKISKLSPGNETELKNNILSLMYSLWVKGFLMLIMNYVIQRYSTV
jgi:hypothetical protein